MKAKIVSGRRKTVSIILLFSLMPLTILGCDSKVPNYTDGTNQPANSDSQTNSTATSSQATSGSSASTNSKNQSQSNTSKKMNPATSTISPDTIATLHTNFGDIEIRFFADKAPKTVESFLTLAKKGFYNKTKFHRVIPGFMIQGGDPLTTDDKNRALDGTGGPGYTVPAEFNDVSFERGIVGLARGPEKNSGGSQFFIMVANKSHLNGQYTAFGQVIKGMSVVDKIVALPRDAHDNPDPKNPAIVESITISKGDPKSFPPIPLIKN